MCLPMTERERERERERESKRGGRQWGVGEGKERERRDKGRKVVRGETFDNLSLYSIDTRFDASTTDSF